MCLNYECFMPANITINETGKASGSLCPPYSRYTLLVLSQQVQGARRSMYQLPVAPSRNIQGGDLWLGWTYQILGLSDLSSLESKPSLLERLQRTVGQMETLSGEWKNK